MTRKRFLVSPAFTGLLAFLAGILAAVMAEAQTLEHDPRLISISGTFHVQPWTGATAVHAPTTFLGIGYYDRTHYDPLAPYQDWRTVRQARLRYLATLTNRTLYFAFDKSECCEHSEIEELNQVATVLQENPDVSLLLDGHADLVGEFDYNAELSFQRAQTIRDHLIAQGAPAGSVKVRPFGEASPAVPVSTKEILNRRVNTQLHDDY